MTTEIFFERLCKQTCSSSRTMTVYIDNFEHGDSETSFDFIVNFYLLVHLCFVVVVVVEVFFQ